MVEPVDTPIPAWGDRYDSPWENTWEPDGSAGRLAPQSQLSHVTGIAAKPTEVSDSCVIPAAAVIQPSTARLPTLPHSLRKPCGWYESVDTAAGSPELSTATDPREQYPPSD